MTLQEEMIYKLDKLPESLVQEVNDFIDFISHRYQAQIVENQPETTLVETWSQWFMAVGNLNVTPAEPEITYPQLLISKYRQQGLDL